MRSTRRTNRPARMGLAGVIFGCLALLIGSLGNSANAAVAVDLGTAADFAVLAGSGITNTGPTTVEGDIGTHPTPAVTGESDITYIGGGENHADDAVTEQAKADLLTAYGELSAQASDSTIPQELVRPTPYLPGLYQGESSLGLSATMTLDAQGDPDAVFIFRTASTLTTGPNSSVLLINGAQACNVFWQVGSSATFGTNTSFVGNVLADTSITANTGATFDGRLLANNGAVTLDTNTITQSDCETGPPGGGVEGTDAEGTDTTGTDAAGTTAEGTDAEGTDTTGTDAAGTTAEGTDAEGTDTAGTDTAGTDTVGTDTAGTDTAGTDTAGTDTAGTDTAGTNTQGTDEEGNDEEGNDEEGNDEEGAGTERTTPRPTLPDTGRDLPDAGGSSLITMLGLASVFGGVTLIAFSQKPRRGAHRL